MSRRKTHEQFVSEIYEIVGDEYSVLSKYEKASIKLTMKHNKCNHEYDVQPNAFLRGNRCPKCFGTPKKTTEWFKRKVFDLVGNEYKVIGEYRGRDKKISMMHHDCGQVFSMRPSHFIERNHRCPNCSKLKQKTQEQFEEQVLSLTNGEYEVIGEYINNREKVEMLHRKCGNTFNMRASAFVNDSQRCPKCKISKGEDRIVNFLINSNITYDTQYIFNGCRNKLPLPFDFAIFDNNRNLTCLIEYDGKQHFHPIEFYGGEDEFVKRKANDNTKDTYCKENNIHLIRIPYWEFNNIEEILNNELNMNNKLTKGLLLSM